MRILQNIHGHDDLLRLSAGEQAQLCEEIRAFLVENVAATGGHLSSNLGLVELSVAIETVFNTHKDRLVFDVGHQSYVHKLLTDRQADFARLRQLGGMAGFPKPSESDTDAFVAGHASNSVSIALGMARARTLQKENYDVIAVIGDGAATGGMAYEGLNDAAVSGERMVVILNDNEMSIAPNVGGFAQHLSRLRAKAGYIGLKYRLRKFLSGSRVGRWVYRLSRRFKDRVKRFFLPTTIFENMGWRYLGPVDGNDLQGMITLLQLAKSFHCPVLIHVQTKKGKGYAPAEADPSRFHGIGKFDPATGMTLSAPKPTFSDTFGQTMLRLAREDHRVCAITAAMPEGTGLKAFMREYPNRTFDVGIAEEHAVSMAGGLAKQGMKPVVALYSTFLQRSYDQLMQDIGLLQLPVVLAVDRAGLVGEDGETHHGVFDVGFLRQIPGMRLLCPASRQELSQMLTWAVKEANGPVALRYPRGGDVGQIPCAWTGSCVQVQTFGKGTDVTIVTYGIMTENALQAADLLAQRNISATVLRLLEISDLSDLHISTPYALVLEDACAGSGIKEAVSWQLRDRSVRVDGIDLGKRFATHGSLQELYRHYGLDGASVANHIEEALQHEK